MDNIDGIPIIWDDADKLFGSLFPDGVAQGMQGFAGVQRGAQSPQFVSPFMERDGIAYGTNLITDQASSIFACTGADQEGSATYQYYVGTKPLDDGAKVYAAYEGSTIEPHVLHLFYEKEAANKNNLFGNFYIAKMGDSFKGIIDNFGKSKYGLPASINQEKIADIKNYDSLTSYVQSVAYSQNCDNIDFDTTYNAIAREYNSKTDSGKFIEGVNSIDELIAKGLNWCADGIERAMIKEICYIPSDDYTPIIKHSRDTLGPENLTANLFEKTANSPFVKEVEAAIGEARSFITNALKNLGKSLYNQLPESIKKVIRKMHQLVQELKTGLDTILQYVGDFIKAVGSVVLEVLQLINAFLCGIMNGILSTVEVIMRILAFLIDKTGMDGDYKSYLIRRDLGEKLESVWDFITESISSIVNGIISLFTQPTETTAEDLKRFLQSIGSLIENVGGKIGDFFENTSRFKYAYYAGYGFFEVCINVLLLFLTGGLGNIAKALTASDKIIATLKIFGKEAFSVATFGVVDILALFKSLIGAFVRACKKGLKGFLRWVEELIKGLKSGKAKSMDDLLEDAEKAGELERLIENLFDDLGGRILNEDDLKLLKNKLKEKYGVDLRLIDKEKGFQKLPITKNGKTEYIRSSDLLKDWDARNVVGKFHEGPPPVIILRSNNASELTVFHEKVHMEVWFNKLPKMNIVDEEKFVFEAIFNAKDKFRWTNNELIDSYDYVNKIVGDWNKLGKNFSKIVNEEIEQFKINKTLGIL